ncbi:MAG: FG-GAP repeat protein, partial [Acidobacteriota bacterium]
MYFNSNANRRPPFSTTRPAALAGLLLAATWLPTLPAKAQCFDDNLAKVVAGSSLINDHMGEAVAVHGDVAVLGSPDDEEGGFMNAGSVSVFRRDPGTGQWTEEQRVVAGDPSGSAFFGRSVDIYGDTLIVGNTEHSPAGIATGAAYIFRYDGVSWNEEQKLTLAAPDPGDRFGFSVGIWGDTAVVGADSRDVGFEDDAGSAYVYEFNGLAWISVATLVAPDALEDAFLGHSIAIHDNWIIAGAWADNANFLDGGAAYIFSDQGAGWAYFQKIISNNLTEDDLFGTAVDIHGDRAIVGAQFHDTLGQNRGAAYIFEIGMLGAGWLQVAEVTASDVEPFDRFG